MFYMKVGVLLSCESGYDSATLIVLHYIILFGSFGPLSETPGTE